MVENFSLLFSKIKLFDCKIEFFRNFFLNKLVNALDLK